MKPGWNPTRRNRNIGTKAHGHGNDNRLVIPESWWQPKSYFETLQNYRLVVRTIHDCTIRFYVEPTRPDWFYACSIDDLAHALSFCSLSELRTFDFIVLRQPTRKQRILCPVWGRAIWQFDMGQRSGPAIVIEAQCLETIKWTKALGPERRRELDRLHADGHRIIQTRQATLIKPSQHSLRNTVLYRTLFHELGHHVDFNRSDADSWHGKTPSTKEDFAHRYAQEKTTALFDTGQFPFPARLEDASLKRDALERNWFEPD